MIFKQVRRLLAIEPALSRFAAAWRSWNDSPDDWADELKNAGESLAAEWDAVNDNWHPELRDPSKIDMSTLKICR